ncbi:MAG TPA: anti-sigma factor [Candidatus Acidoferrales bacterium]|nr:anti-sigma factor [Candidatus Acidoferrales bacterium]
MREHYEAYAIGALDGADRAELEAHLARNCPACTAGVAQARYIVSQLALAAPDQAPPASLRAKIMEAARAEAASPQRATRIEPVVRRTWIPTWAWAAAAVLILFAAYSLYQNVKMQRDLNDLNASLDNARRARLQLDQQRATYDKAMAILQAQGTHSMPVKPSDGKMPMLQAYIHEKMGVVIAASNVPMPAQGREYQLWMVPKTGKGAPISAGVYMPDSSGSVLAVAPPMAKMEDIAALAVTEEPMGGSPQPTSRPMWMGSLQ